VGSDGRWLGDEKAEGLCGSTGRFSSCYDQDSTQEDIYDNDVKPLLDVLYNGVVSTSRFVPFGITLTLAFLHKTVTIFAYGVTSSGKTHTMQGSSSQPGIIPRVMHVRMVTDFGITTLNYRPPRKSCTAPTQTRARS